MQHAFSTPDRVCPSWNVLLCVHMSRLSLCGQLTHEVHITYCTYVSCVNDHVHCGFAVLVFHVLFRLQTSTLLGELHKQLLWSPLILHLLLPRELQPLSEVHPVLLSRAHCVPSVGGQHLLQWVQCGVHHPQPDEVCELPVHCHHTHWQPEGKPHCRGKYSHAKWVTATDLRVDGLTG